MFSVRLPIELENSLAILAKQLKVNKSKVVIEALTKHIENQQDYISASKIFKSNNKKYTHEEMLSELGL